MTDDFGPIIEHDGSCIPVPIGTAVWVQDASGCAAEIIAEPPNAGGSGFIWASLSSRWYPHRIVRYRQKRSRALLSMIERAKELDGPALMPEQVSA